MWCSSRGVEPGGAVTSVGSDPARPATDDDRHRTQSLLGAGAGQGHLGVEDLDARLAEVWRATTVGELMRIEAGLPEQVREEHERLSRVVRQREAARDGLRGHATWYVAVMVLLVALWTAGGLSEGDWYPWPLWPAFFWGMAVAGQARAARAPLS